MERLQLFAVERGDRADRQRALARARPSTRGRGRRSGSTPAAAAPRRGRGAGTARPRAAAARQPGAHVVGQQLAGRRRRGGARLPTRGLDARLEDQRVADRDPVRGLGHGRSSARSAQRGARARPPAPPARRGDGTRRRATRRAPSRRCRAAASSARSTPKPAATTSSGSCSSSSGMLTPGPQQRHPRPEAARLVRAQRRQQLQGRARGEAAAGVVGAELARARARRPAGPPSAPG